MIVQRRVKNKFTVTLTDGATEELECGFVETGKAGELFVTDVTYRYDDTPEPEFRWWYLFTRAPRLMTPGYPPLYQTQRIYQASEWSRVDRAEVDNAPR